VLGWEAHIAQFLAKHGLTAIPMRPSRRKLAPPPEQTSLFDD
jgi:hypothetical protein